MRQDDPATAGDPWIDLSTPFNRRIWPAPTPPDGGSAGHLARAAAARLGCDPAQVRAVADARKAFLRLPAGRAAVLGRSASGHAARLRAAGWQVTQVTGIGAMAGADLAVVVNPNDPDGRDWPPEALIGLARRVGHLVVDEGFADARPDLSLAPALPVNAILLRSLGRFGGCRGRTCWWLTRR